MPRILPRLLQALKDAALKANENTPCPVVGRRPKTVSLWRPPPAYPNFSVKGRTQSLLLDELSPVIHERKYRRHKKLPPRVRLHKSQKHIPGSRDRPRRMTEEEREWWSSPYLRMLASPIRKCVATERYLPSDFMIRIAPMQLPVPRNSRPAQVLLPDGLEHPKYKGRKVGVGYHIICLKSAIAQLDDRMTYKRFCTNVSLHGSLAKHIGHLLRVRVLQELELLAAKLACFPRGAEENPVLRRLTRAEFKEVRNTGSIPYENALALLIVPPLNKNSVTKQRPEPSLSSLPITEDESKKPARPLPPISVLHPAIVEDQEGNEVDLGLLVSLPSARVPLYNGLALFPSKSQRAAVHKVLNQVLFVERRARWREHGPPGPKNNSDDAAACEDIEPVSPDMRARGDQKASHAYLLCSDSTRVKRADVAPLAIALWRVRMWEGGGWGDGGDTAGGWKITPLKAKSL